MKLTLSGVGSAAHVVDVPVSVVVGDAACVYASFGLTTEMRRCCSPVDAPLPYASVLNSAWPMEVRYSTAAVYVPGERDPLMPCKLTPPSAQPCALPLLVCDTSVPSTVSRSATLTFATELCTREM